MTAVNGAVFFSYGPDGERIRKSDGFGITVYLANSRGLSAAGNQQVP